MAAQSSDQFANTLFDLITGHRVTAVIYVAAQLGICDLLAEGRKSATELARLTDTHERSLLRLMRTLVALGLCKEAGAGEFELTGMGAHLAAGSELSLKAWALV
jgi:DNA-binding IclR family transcriptional regulator